VFDQRILDELQDLALAWGEIVHVGSCMCVQILFLYTVNVPEASAASSCRVPFQTLALPQVHTRACVNPSPLKSNRRDLPATELPV
jgi:hypothetical protein